MNIAFLEEILRTNTPSGYEEEFMTVMDKYLSPISDVKYDNMGNCIAISNAIYPYKVLIMAHCDEIGFQVVGIDENGYVKFRPIGGMIPTYLPGSSVLILNKKNTIQGCISYCPIHIQSPNDKKEINFDDLWIDIGVKNKKEAESLISIGDAIVTDSKPFYSANKERLFSKGLDNKIGVYAMIESFINLVKMDLPISLAIAATVQEELGCRGCNAVINQIKPDLVIVLDTGICGDIPVKIDTKFGVVELGNGPGINYNPTNNKKLNDLILDIAKNNQILHQKTVGYLINRGTENASIQMLLNGVITSHICIPIRNMHMPYEICHIKDIENTIQLLEKTITYLAHMQNKENAFVPW